MMYGYGQLPVDIQSVVGMSLLELGRQVGDVCHTANVDQQAQGYESYCLKSVKSIEEDRQQRMVMGAVGGAVVGAIVGVLIGRAMK